MLESLKNRDPDDEDDDDDEYLSPEYQVDYVLGGILENRILEQDEPRYSPPLKPIKE